MDASESASNALTKRVNALKNEENFINSFRFCCAMFSFIMLCVFLLIILTMDLAMTHIHRIPKFELGTKVNAYVAGLDQVFYDSGKEKGGKEACASHTSPLDCGTFKMCEWKTAQCNSERDGVGECARLDMHSCTGFCTWNEARCIDGKLFTLTSLIEILKVWGFINLSVKMGNPWHGRMKVGKVTGKVWLGDDDIEKGVHLADAEFYGVDAIDADGMGEHVLNVFISTGLFNGATVILERITDLMATADRKISISVDIKFSDIWLELFFNRRWTIGFDFRGSVSVNNDLGLETAAICVRKMKFQDATLCFELWKRECSPCVRCKPEFNGNVERRGRHRCVPQYEETQCVDTCKRRFAGLPASQQTFLTFADVTGTNCGVDEDSIRRLDMSNTTRRCKRNPMASFPETIAREENKRRQRTSEGDTTIDGRRLFDGLRDDEGIKDFRLTYFNEMENRYTQKKCEEDAFDRWLKWYLKQFQENVVGDLLKDLQRGRLPFWPSNPRGTLWTQFFLPIILAISFLFSVSCAVCCRVFGMHAYHRYQDRSRKINKEQDDVHMGKFLEHHPEFKSRPSQDMPPPSTAVPPSYHSKM